MAKQDNAMLKAAFLVENGFCERELVQTQNALRAIDIDCRIISSEKNAIKSWNENKVARGSHWGLSYAVDKSLDTALASDYDILVIPGGKRSINKLKLESNVRSFISFFFTAKKPVITYNQGADLLGFLGLLSGYSVAAKDQVCDTMSDAGGRCAASEFVVSGNLISLSRFRDVEHKIQDAVKAIVAGEKYEETVVSTFDVPPSHKAA